MKSRIFQAIFLLVLFVAGVIFYNAISSPPPKEVPAEGATQP